MTRQVSGTALALVLAAAVLHATWNLAVKGASAEDRVAFIWLYIVTTVVRLGARRRRVGGGRPASDPHVVVARRGGW